MMHFRRVTLSQAHRRCDKLLSPTNSRQAVCREFGSIQANDNVEDVAPISARSVWCVAGLFNIFDVMLGGGPCGPHGPWPDGPYPWGFSYYASSTHSMAGVGGVLREPPQILGQILVKGLVFRKNVVTLHRVSPTRPAPRELRQALIGATVPGCSGAM